MDYHEFSNISSKDCYEENFLRYVIPSPSVASAYITGEYLKQLADFVNGVYGGPPATELLIPHDGANSPWKTLLSDSGWKVQVRLDNRHERKYQILNPHNHLITRGSSNQILRPIIERHIEQSKIARMRRSGNNNIAIVFDGGGAKGAYQVGVWRWLRQQSEIDKSITGVSGASVGALNALLFANGDLDLAENVWNNVRQDDLTPVNKIPIRVGNFVAKAGAIGVSGVVASAAISALSMTALPSIGVAALSNAGPLISVALATSGVMNANVDDLGLFPRDRLLNIILKSGISMNRVRHSGMLAFTSLSAFRHVPHPQHLIQQHGYQKGKAILIPEYRCWQAFAGNNPDDELLDTVLASAAFPGVYAPKEINGIAYWDGGFLDNSPIIPLIKANFKHIIVVHLSTNPDIAYIDQAEQYRAGNRMSGSAYNNLRRIYHIIPSCDLGKTFSTGGIHKRYSLGYDDAQRQLSKTFLPFIRR